MSEKKIVIKLNYGEPSAKPHRSTPTPEYEWNYKRITIALLIGVAIGILAYWLSIGTPRTEVAGSTEKSYAEPESVATENQRALTQSEEVNRDQIDQNIDSNTLADHDNSNLAVSETANIVQETPSIDTQITPAQEVLESKVVETATSQQATHSDVATGIDPKNIARAQFSWGIKDKEPTSYVTSPAILRPGDSVTLYFFSEFNNMSGQSVSHEWSRNGKFVWAKNFRVEGNLWRVFSSKRLTSDVLGEWTVTIKDASGENLGEYTLKVLQPKT